MKKFYFLIVIAISGFFLFLNNPCFGAIQNQTESGEKRTEEVLEEVEDWVNKKKELELFKPVFLFAIKAESLLETFDKNLLGDELKFIVQLAENSVERIISVIISNEFDKDFKIQFLIKEIKFLKKLLIEIETF